MCPERERVKLSNQLQLSEISKGTLRAGTNSNPFEKKKVLDKTVLPFYIIKYANFRTCR